MKNQDRRDGGPFERVGEALGEAAGRAAGRATDMAMDVAGTMMQSAASMLGGWWSQGESDRAARSFSDREERACREHFDTTTRAASTRQRDYDTTRPLYQFGHVAGQNPDYQGKSFDEVEPDLQRVWEAAGRERFGDWPEVRGYVGFGYEQRSRDDRDFR